MENSNAHENRLQVDQESPTPTRAKIDYVYRGWMLLAAFLTVALLIVSAYRLMFDRLDSEATVLTEPPRFQLDINSATAPQLQALPEIGERLAARIVSYRTEHGWFGSVRELQKVRGFGPTRLARLKEMLTVAESDAPWAERSAVNQLSQSGASRH